MTKPRKVVTHYVTADTAPRLCRRPERIPGVAPPCEDAMIEDGRRRRSMSGYFGEANPLPVSLPRIASLEKDFLQ
jgi:hypothetical protein